METWIDSFNRDQADQKTQRDDVEARHLERAHREERRRLGVDERVRRLISALPDNLKGQPLPISYFIERMGAKWRPGGRAHAGEVGGALTRLGWTRRRMWRSQTFHGRYPAAWFPPDTESN